MNAVMVVGEIRTGPKVTALSDGTLELRIRISADTRAPRSKQWVTLLLTDEWAEAWEPHLLIGVTVEAKGSLKWRSFVHKQVRYDVAEVHVEHLSLSDHQDAGSQASVKGDGQESAEKSSPVAVIVHEQAGGETVGSNNDTPALPFGPPSMDALESLRHRGDNTEREQASSTPLSQEGASAVNPVATNEVTLSAIAEQPGESQKNGDSGAQGVETGASNAGISQGLPAGGSAGSPTPGPQPRPGARSAPARKAIKSVSRIDLEGGTDY